MKTKFDLADLDREDVCALVDILDFIKDISGCEFTHKDGEHWCLSPLKQEKTPSFSVSKEKQKFFDFSSKIGGDVINFAAAYFRCSNDEAIRKILEYGGVTDTCSMPRRPCAVKVAKRFVVEDNSRREDVPSKPLPKNYMDRYERNLEKLNLWVEEGISLEELDRFSVRYDPLQQRLVFPVRSQSGDIINICGRAIRPDWKERGERKYTFYFSHGSQKNIGGLSDNMEYIKEKKEIILFEGLKSVMLASTFGYRNCGALMTSTLNESQKKTLIGLNAKIIFALDKGIDPRKDVRIRKLKKFKDIGAVMDFKELLRDKESPVDRGKDVWEFLYKNRVIL